MDESVGAANIADNIEATEQDTDQSCAEDSINNAVIGNIRQNVEFALRNDFPLSQGRSKCSQNSPSNSFLKDQSVCLLFFRYI